MVVMAPKSSLRSPRGSQKLTFSARHEMSEPASEFFVAAGLGIEPKFSLSESDVLPLDDPAIVAKLKIL